MKRTTMFVGAVALSVSIASCGDKKREQDQKTATPNAAKPVSPAPAGAKRRPATASAHGTPHEPDDRLFDTIW